VPQIVGPLHQRRGELPRGERGGPDLLPHLPPGGRLERIPVLGAEQPPVRVSAELLDVGPEEFDELGRDRDFADGPAGARAGSALGAALEAAVFVGLAVIGVCLTWGGAGVGEDQVAPSALGQVAALFDAGASCMAMQSAMSRQSHWSTRVFSRTRGKPPGRW
jgi:hypothetical protein